MNEAINCIMFSLLRAALHGNEVSELDKRMTTAKILAEAMAIARKQDMAHLAALAILNNDLADEESKLQMQQYVYQAVHRYEKLNYELRSVCETLEKARIPFIPLKGAVLRDHYPEPWMRTSGDIDILVRVETLEQTARLLTEKLGYQYNGKGDHDVLLRASNGVLLELHYDTITERYANNNVRKVLARIWEDANPTASDSCHYQMSDAMFYFYHIAHMVKHFEAGGCGVRSFLDIWIMNHRMDFDKVARDELLQEGGLLKFAQAAETLAEAWFSGTQMDDMTKQLQDYILRAGLYGDNENRAALGQLKNGGKVRYVLFQRIFLPYTYLKAEYPILEKKKWLVPIYQVVRWCKVLQRKETIRRVAELKVNAKVSEEDTAAVAKLLEHLGI